MPSMDFNGRMSSVRSSQQSSQQKRKEPDEDAFMTLDDREIAGCISDIGIAFSVDDLRKPQPHQIQKIFEWFAELLTNTTRDVVAPAMRAAAEDMCGADDADRIFTADTRELMGFFVTMRKLLLECGIRDFTFSDMYRPTHPRLVRIFSYIINFIRFRESQTSVIDEHYNSSENTKNMIDKLYHENEEKRERLEEMLASRADVERAIREKEEKTEKLAARLRELKNIQTAVSDRHAELEQEKARLKETLESLVTKTLDVKQETEKLRPYTEQSPAVLEQALRDLSNNLVSDKAETERMDKRTRALQTSYDSFSTVIAELTSLHKLLTDLQAELNKEDDEARTAANTREALSEQTRAVQEVEHAEAILLQKLNYWQSRTAKVRENAEAKAEDAARKMESLRATHRELIASRKGKEQDAERRRIRIEQTEKKMDDLKHTIQNEVQSAKEEYMKMESHIRLYITEMEQSI